MEVHSLSPGTAAFPNEKEAEIKVAGSFDSTH
jgi:hypothetical protein